MSNRRTTKKQITWHLEATECQDLWIRELLEVGAYEGGFGKAAKDYFRKLLDLVPREGEDDEKGSTTSDDDLTVDDLLELDGPDLPMGPAESGRHDRSGTAVPEHPRSKTIFGATCNSEEFFASLDPQGHLAQRTDRPGLDASSTDTNLSRLKKLADVCSGYGKDDVAEGRDKPPYGPTWSEQYKCFR